MDRERKTNQSFNEVELLYEEIEKLIESSQIEDDIEKKKEYIKSAIEILSSQNKVNEENDDWNFLNGYCWYNYPDNSDKRNMLIERYLLNALSINNKHQLSVLYLIYHYFDTKQYELVFSLVKSIEKETFSKMHQWQRLKIDELVISSKLYQKQNDVNNLKLEIIKVFETYLKTDEINLAIPKELIHSLYVSLKHGNIKYKSEELVLIVLRIMKKYDYCDLFPEEYQYFKNILKV